MRSKGPSPQTMGKTCPFPIHIWVSDPSGSRQQPHYRVYWNHRGPGVFVVILTLVESGGGRAGTTGTGPVWRHCADPYKNFRGSRAATDSASCSGRTSASAGPRSRRVAAPAPTPPAWG